MKLTPTRLFVILISVAAMTVTGCDNHSTTINKVDSPETVTVTGTGEITAAPEVFRIRAVSSRRGDNIEAMQQEVDGEIRAALELAASLDIPDRHVEATRIDIQPEWQWQPVREIIGHRVAREIRLRVDGIETYASVLGELTRLGFTEIGQVGREVSDPESLREEALKKAVADARRKAAILSQAADRSLGRALLIEEEASQRYQPQMMARTMEADSGDSYSPGEITIDAKVRLVFLLE